MNTLDLQCRFDTSGDGTFTGHAVLWGDINRHKERYEPGVFANSLAEHRVAGSRPMMLWSHDQSAVIGVWTDIREDNKGLAVEGRIVRETARGAEAYALLKAGAVNGLSIGFRALSDKRDAQGVRVLTDVDLAEISLVGMPSGQRSRISEVRNHQTEAGRLSAFINACRDTASTLSKA